MGVSTAHEEHKQNVRDHIKNVIDNKVKIVQENRHTGKVFAEMNFKEGGLSNMILKTEEIAMP